MINLDDGWKMWKDNSDYWDEWDIFHCLGANRYSETCFYFVEMMKVQCAKCNTVMSKDLYDKIKFLVTS